MDIENPTSALSQSLLSSSLEQSMESKKNSNSQYDAVKMRYFSSLGMNRPPPQMSSSVPTHSYMNGSSGAHVSSTQGNHPIPAARQRTKTAPSPKSESLEEMEKEELRKRTTSVPIPIGFTANLPAPGMSISVGTYLTSSFDEDDDSDSTPPGILVKVKSAEWTEDIFGNDENINFGFESSTAADKPQDSPVKFVPPHEMMANSKKDFNVGTAHSVAVWEQRRRKFI